MRKWTRIHITPSKSHLRTQPQNSYLPTAQACHRNQSERTIAASNNCQPTWPKSTPPANRAHLRPSNMIGEQAQLHNHQQWHPERKRSPSNLTSMTHHLKTTKDWWVMQYLRWTEQQLRANWNAIDPHQSSYIACPETSSSLNYATVEYDADWQKEKEQR